VLIVTESNGADANNVPLATAGSATDDSKNTAGFFFFRSNNRMTIVHSFNVLFPFLTPSGKYLTAMSRK